MNTVCEGHLLVVVGVDYMQKRFNLLCRNDSQTLHESSELWLIEHTIVVDVDRAELLGESGQELLVLFQLEVEDRLQEHAELQAVLH